MRTPILIAVIFLPFCIANSFAQNISLLPDLTEYAGGETSLSPISVTTILPNSSNYIEQPYLNLSADDRRFINEATQTSWQGFNRMVDANTGLPYGIVRNSEILEVAYSRVTPTEIGLWMTAIVAARDLGFLQPEEAEARVRKVLSSLEQIKGSGDAPHGFFYQSYNAENLVREEPFLSSVDNGNLAASLMVVANAFQGVEGITDRATAILNDMDFKFFYNSKTGLMNVGFDEIRGEYSQYDYGIFNTEARLSVLVALLKDGMSRDAWDNMRNTTKYFRTVSGEIIPVAASLGGSIFENFYADMYLNENKYSPDTLGENNKRVAQIHLKEQPDKLGINIGGWSPSQDESGYYKESGVPYIGEAGYPLGRQISPYSALLAFRSDPEEAAAVLNAMRELNPQIFNNNIGFCDAINPTSGNIGPNIVSLDKGMEIVSLFNALQAINNRGGIDNYLWGYLADIGKDTEGQNLLAQRRFENSFYLSNQSLEIQGPQLPEFKIPLENIGVFYNPDLYANTPGAHEFWADDPYRKNILGVSYYVGPKDAISGLYIKTNLDLTGYDTFNIGVGGLSNAPKLFRFELKYGGEVKQYIDVTNISDYWEDLSFSISPNLGKIDEIVVVFDQNLVGEYAKTGTVFIDPNNFSFTKNN